MKQIELERGTLLAVEMPEGASDLTLPKVGMIDLYFQTKRQSDNEEDNYISIALPDVGFEPLGLSTYITEEQAKMMVDKISMLVELRYKHYNHGGWAVTALESLRSILDANGIHFKNKNKRCECVMFTKQFEECRNINKSLTSCSAFDEWQEAQQDVKKWFLLFKPKK